MEKLTLKLNKKNFLLKADTIIFQFPMFWFKSPYLLSKWVEDVFTHGFAYGSSGNKLEGKKLIVSITMGGDENEFKGKFDLERLVGPFECTALFVKMKFGGYAYTFDIPFTIKDTPDVAKVKKEQLEKQAEKVFSLVKN